MAGQAPLDGQKPLRAGTAWCDDEQAFKFNLEDGILPELTRFFGIIIRMYTEPGVPHHRPHFHAYYQNHVAIYGVDPIELMGGNLPQRQRRLVEAWAELHQGELLENWERLQSGRLPYKIVPLK